MPHHAANAFANSWVHIGPWLNWGKSPLGIATFTSTHFAGSIFVSFLTAFITLTGAFCWCIICFVVHQYRSTQVEKDGHFHQTQVTMRNSAQDSNTIVELFKLGYAWGRKSEKNIKRVCRLSFIAIVHFALFHAAALMSSAIYSTTDEVLVRSNYCKVFPAGAPDTALDNAWNMKERATARWALDWSRTCWNDDIDQTSQCAILASPNFRNQQRVYTDQPCPFSPDLCLDPEAGAITIDSGKVNTNRDLGLNSRKGSSIDYRRVTTCAPLRTQEYSWQQAGYLDGDEIMVYNYGPRINGSDGEVSDHSFARSGYSRNLTSDAYTLNALAAYLNNETMSNFNPNSSLVRDDADVSILPVFLDALYTGPVNDLFFQASTDTPGEGWMSDNPVGVMGCTEQHQFCDASGSQECTALSGYWENGKTTMFDGTQNEVASWLFYAIENNFLWHMAGDLGGDALAASLFVSQGSWRDSSPLPDGQWQNEVVGWHQFIMARMQKLIVEIAAGPQIDSATGYTVADFGQYMEDFPRSELLIYDVCKNVKIRDSSFYSWNTVGVVVIIVVGLAIIFTSLFLESIVGFIQKRTRRWAYKRQDWIQDHVVHLQRHGYEKSVAHVSWTGHEHSVPTTERKEKFASLSRHSLPVTQPGNVYSVGSPKSSTAPFVNVRQTVSPVSSPGLVSQTPLSPESSSNSGYFQRMPPQYPSAGNPV